MRVERIEGNQIEVLRGVLGTSMQPHPPGAPVVVVNQPTSWTTYYRKLTPHSEELFTSTSATMLRKSMASSPGR